MAHRVLLLMPTHTYKAGDFLEAASSLDVSVVVGTDGSQALVSEAPGNLLVLSYREPERAVREIVAYAGRYPIAAVVGTDDEAVPIAAMAAEALGLPHNPVDAARASRDKHEARKRLAAAGLRTPAFRLVRLDESPREAALRVGYPCVLKPLDLSAGRGVMRADDPASFVAAFDRIAKIVAGRNADRLLVEGYIPGDEVAVEGLLERGRFRMLALFDKPDPLSGPAFEESLYITPSRLARTAQQAIAEETARACEALGLREGPVHAEFRVRDGLPWTLEVAARTIGGICSRSLRFGAGVSLEELTLRHALGMETASLIREREASGVMMIPTPRPGVLNHVRGVESARAVSGIVDVVVSIPVGAEVAPPPEGHRYLGFLFARGNDPAQVEDALRRAHALLRFTIEDAPISKS